MVAIINLGTAGSGGTSFVFVYYLILIDIFGSIY